MGKKTKISIITVLIYIINSAISAVLSLVYNNLVIKTYGSNVNGLISTLTQFISMFSIIEGGFTTAAVVAIYKPLVEKDYKKLNDILYTAKRTFLKISIVITGAVLVGGSLYLLFIDSPFSYAKTFLLLIACLTVTSLSLGFQTSYSILLQGDNKAFLIASRIFTKSVI